MCASQLETGLGVAYSWNDPDTQDLWTLTTSEQEVLAEPAWRDRMTVDDWRGLTPLIYHHVNPYGRIELDMARRLALAA